MTADQSQLAALLPEIGRRAVVMGVLNVTPDSFSDGGAFENLEAAVTHALRMVAEGARIIDVGGESTRPHAAPVSEEEEIARIKPAMTALGRRISVPISIDTSKSGVARVALTAGARIVNDVWGLQRDPDIARVAADFGAPVIVMHNRDEINPELDIVDDMRRFFERSLAIAVRCGLSSGDIVLDPGVGFGKTLEQNLRAIAAIPTLKAMGHRVLLGASRKSFIGRITGVTAPKDRLHGSIAAHAVGVALGADIVRVHDVRAHAEAMPVAAAIGAASRMRNH